MQWKNFASLLLEIGAAAAAGEWQGVRHIKRAQRHDAKGHAGGDGLYRQSGIKVVDREVERSSDLRAIVNRSEDRIVLLIVPKTPCSSRVWRREAYGNRTDAQIERDSLRATQNRMIPVEPARSAKRRMPRKLQFFAER